MEGGRSEQPSTMSQRDTTRWSVDWGGVIALAVVVVVVLLVWQRFGGDDATDEASASTAPPSTDAVATTTSPAATTTTTVAPTTTTSTTIPGPRVLISGEVKPCQFGSSCLVADFEIEGFDPHPGVFACIYPNSRSEFGFNDDDVDDACLSGDEGDTITIEVDGVRSATISAEHLDGAPAGESADTDG